jgi:hypothetical protein
MNICAMYDFDLYFVKIQYTRSSVRTKFGPVKELGVSKHSQGPRGPST